LFFLSENPFEFALPGCDLGLVEDWRDILTSGCVDLSYAAQFIGIYGAVLFVLLLAAWALYRLIMSYG
jgi:hypothetical protein